MDKPTPSRPAGFWQRQFGPERTIGQFVFDILFGGIAPVLCLIFDPIVFHSDDPCYPALLASWRAFVYVAVGLGVLSLISWLVFYQRVAFVSGLLAGVFFAGAVVAGYLGVGLVPWSVLGLVFAGLGALGFTPFFTAFVYWRNGVRAWRLAKARFAIRGRFWAWATLLVGVIISQSLPLFAQYPVEPLLPPQVVARDCSRSD